MMYTYRRKFIIIMSEEWVTHIRLLKVCEGFKDVLNISVEPWWVFCQQVVDIKVVILLVFTSY